MLYFALYASETLTVREQVEHLDPVEVHAGDLPAELVEDLHQLTRFPPPLFVGLVRGRAVVDVEGGADGHPKLHVQREELVLF